MDPLTAFSLVASILQFIDFTSKLASKSHAVYKTGALSDHVSIEAAMLRLRSLAESIQSSSRFNAGTSASEASAAYLALSHVVTECLDISTQLEDALSKFRSKNGGKLESAWVALRAMIKHNSLEALEDRLSRCRQELLFNFIVIIQSDVDSVNEKLDKLGTESQQGHGKTQNDLKAGFSQIMAAIELSKSQKPNGVDLEEVSRGLEQLNINSAATQAFLDDLYLPIWKARERQIVEAAENTFSWIFDTEEGFSDNEAVHADATNLNVKLNPSRSTGFENWLSAGEGIFWITGKPGCGKSTIMKYIYNHAATRAALQTWAGQAELVVAAAYFWSSGDPRERSSVGLWRSLLYNILSKHPSLIGGLFPWRWRRYETTGKCSEEISEDELLQAIEKLSSAMDRSYCFCFFIDGLDEFQGDQKKLTQSLQKLAKNDKLKICVSSRPWETFSSSFTNSPSISVDHWTVADIKKFADQQLSQHPNWTSLQAGATEDKHTLIDEISKQSSGVFLWVHLVVQELKTAIDDGDSIQELIRRLDVIPSDLNDFIKRILHNIPPQYQDQTKRHLILLLAPGINYLWLHAYVEEQTSSFGEMATVSPLSISVTLSKFASLKRRVESRCRDLVEISDIEFNQSSLVTPFDRLMKQYSRYTRFTHRSVRDFLLGDGVEYLRSYLVDCGFEYKITNT